MTTDKFDEEVRMEFYRSGVQVAREIGFMALKTLITLNSGAFVVLLTFIGNTQAQSQFVVPLPAPKCAMYSFFVGIAAAFLSITYTYLVSQQSSPYPSEPGRTDGLFVPLIVAITSISFFAFLWGVLVVVWSVQPAFQP